MSNRLLILLAVFGVLGLFVALALRERSFPVSTIEFRLLSTDAERRAAEFVIENGIDPGGYRVTSGFSVDDTAKNYVHQTAGLEALNRLAKDKLAIWYWQTRYYQELQQEEASVFTTPDGRVVGFARTIPEARPGASPSMWEAQATAESFLANQGQDLARYRMTSSSATKREARVDHFFTWEEVGFRVGEATSRIDVWLHGDTIGGFNQYLKVPEEWRRAQAVIINRGNVLAVTGWALTYALGFAMAFVALIRLRDGRVNWRFALGLALLLGGVGIATAVNSAPLLMLGYPTTSTVVAYLADRLQSQAGALIPGGVAVVLAAIAGEYLYGERFPRLARPSVVLSRRGLATREFVVGIASGYAVAGIWLGYVTVFYSLGSALFGFWSPAEVPYRDLMSTLLPAVYPLTVGFSAAVSEELMFRLFAVPLFLAFGERLWLRTLRRWLSESRLAHSVWLASFAIVPAAIWASLHATYPQQPFYARTVELTIVGALNALLMARFGILSAITAHYAYNASVIGGLFLLSGRTYLQASALLVIALPLALLLPAFRSLRVNRSLASADRVPVDQTERRQRQPSVTTVQERRIFWLAPQRRLLEVLAIGLICLLVTVAWRVPRFGDQLQVSTSPLQAQTASAEYAHAVGLDIENYQVVTTFADWSHGSAAAYLLRQIGTAATNSLLADGLRAYTWQTRYYRPLTRTELFVRFAVQGGFQGLELRLPEDAPGASLEQDAARTIAEDFIRQHGDPRVLNWRMVRSASERRPARTDHFFEWEDSANRVGEAAMRLRVGVEGDSVGEYTVFLKVPEAFERELGRQLDADALLRLGRDGLPLTILVVGVVAFIQRFRQRSLNLRFAAGAAGLMAGLDTVGAINGLPTFYAGYWTTIEPEAYVVWRVVDILRGIGGDTAWRFVLFAVAESLFREVFPGRAWLGEQARALVRPGGAEWRAGLAALASAPILWLWLAAYRAAREAFASGSLTSEGTVPGHLLTLAVPPVTVWQANATFALWVALGGTAVTLWLWQRTRRKWLVLVAWALGLTFLYTGRADEWQRFLIEAARWSILVGAVYVLVARYLRGQVFAYAVALYALLAGREALFLLGQPEPSIATAGAVALLGSVLPAVWLLAAGSWRASRQR